MHTEQSRAVSIPLERIRILNPRARNRRKHQEIVESIGAVGLKRPITVSRREDIERHKCLLTSSRYHHELD